MSLNVRASLEFAKYADLYDPESETEDEVVTVHTASATSSEPSTPSSRKLAEKELVVVARAISLPKRELSNPDGSIKDDALSDMQKLLAKADKWILEKE